MGKLIQAYMKPLKMLVATGDSTQFSSIDLKNMLLDELKLHDYDELKWKHDTYYSTESMQPIRRVRVTTFQIVKDVKELEGINLIS